MPDVSERTKNFKESVIRMMTRIANKYQAINLSQGFPDFDPPIEILESLKEISLKGPHQYSITWGSRNFREALARKQSKFMNLKINPDENIVVTCGSTEAMMASMMTVCNPKDKVIVFSPFYENYVADTILSGAEPIYVPLTPPDFSFDINILENAFKQKPKAIILCNPSNPSGKVFTLDELTIISDFAKKYDTFVITDEVYEHIIYEPYKHLYISSLKDMFERTICCSSLSKTYSITGWRLGYVIASKKIIESVKKVHDFLTVGAASPLQEAAVTGLNFKDDYYKGLQNEYMEKKIIFTNYLKKAGLKYTDPQGAYYTMVDISEFSKGNDIEFCEWLAREIGVAAVPGSTFFKEPINHLIRFHFAKKNETLVAAGERLLKLKEIGRQ